MTRKSMAAAAAVARLQPWVAALQQLTPPVHNEVSPFQVDDAVARVVWFDGRELVQSPRFETIRECVCEGLSLLALLARVDTQAWKVAVLSIWSSCGELPDWLDDSPPEQFEVGLVLEQLSLESVDSLTCFHGHNRNVEPPSDGYARLRVHWEKELEEGGKTDDDYFADVRVRLELHCLGTEETTALLRRTLQHITDEDVQKDAWRSGSGVSAPRFKVSHVAFDSTIGVQVNLEGMWLLQKIASQKIRVSDIPPLSQELTGDGRSTFVQALRQLTCLDGGLASHPGVGTISINGIFAPRLVPALATAAQYSSNVFKVEIAIGDGALEEPFTRTDLWSYVAYSIFSRHADHNISTLELNLRRLNDDDVEAVRAVLNAPDPCVTFNEDIVWLCAWGVPRYIVASRFTLSFKEDRVSDAVFDANRDIAIRVVDEPYVLSFPWWSVILPGHGVAWVRNEKESSGSRSDLNFINLPHDSAPGFPTIDIAIVSDQSLRAAADLIELIGHETKRINVGELIGDDIAFTQWCERILASCPRLEELSLGMVRMNDLSAFATAAAHGQCCLKRLSVRTVTVDEDPDHLQVFFDALSDSSHALARHLVDVDLDLIIETSQTHLVIDPVVRMLRENQTLLKLRLRIDTVDELGFLLSVFQLAFQEFENQVVSVRTGPLGIREKLAFLSVVHQRSQLAVGQLDTSVLAVVLEFAAHARARKVRFKYGPDRSI